MILIFKHSGDPEKRIVVDGKRRMFYVADCSEELKKIINDEQDGWNPLTEINTEIVGRLVSTFSN